MVTRGITVLGGSGKIDDKDSSTYPLNIGSMDTAGSSVNFTMTDNSMIATAMASMPGGAPNTNAANGAFSFVGLRLGNPSNVSATSAPRMKISVACAGLIFP